MGRLKLVDARKKVMALRQQAAGGTQVKPAQPNVAAMVGVAAAASSENPADPKPASTPVPSNPAAAVPPGALAANATTPGTGEAASTNTEDLKRKRETLLGLLEKRRQLDGVQVM